MPCRKYCNYPQLAHSVGYIVWGPHYSGASARLQPQHQYILTWVALALSKQPFSMDTFPNIGQSLAFSVGLGVCQQQLLQNHGHEIGAQRDPHFILRPPADFLLTFNFPTFGRRAIGPSIYFSQNSRHQRAIQPLTGNQYALYKKENGMNQLFEIW